MTTPTYSSLDAVTVRRIVFPRATVHQPASTHRMIITPVNSKDGTTLKIPYSPNETDYSNIAAEYASVNRAGRQPALVWKNKSRRQMQMTLFIADKYVAVPGRPTAPTLVFSADATARTIYNWARGGSRVKVTYGSFDNGTWRITELSIKAIKRGLTTNNFVMGELSITFEEVIDIVVGTGPVSGGVKPPSSGGGTTKKPTPTSYTVKKGDNLTKISIKFYGTGSKWRKIADYNKLKNPNKLYPGQKLKIPK